MNIITEEFFKKCYDLYMNNKISSGHLYEIDGQKINYSGIAKVAAEYAQTLDSEKHDEYIMRKRIVDSSFSRRRYYRWHKAFIDFFDGEITWDNYVGAKGYLNNYGTKEDFDRYQEYISEVFKPFYDVYLSCKKSIQNLAKYLKENKFRYGDFTPLEFQRFAVEYLKHYIEKAPKISQEDQIAFEVFNQANECTSQQEVDTYISNLDESLLDELLSKIWKYFEYLVSIGLESIEAKEDFKNRYLTIIKTSIANKKYGKPEDANLVLVAKRTVLAYIQYPQIISLKLFAKKENISFNFLIKCCTVVKKEDEKLYNQLVAKMNIYKEQRNEKLYNILMDIVFKLNDDESSFDLLDYFLISNISFLRTKKMY